MTDEEYRQTLRDRLGVIRTQLAALLSVDVSNQGRSVSSSASRKSLMDEEQQILKTLAGMGDPVATLYVPFNRRSRLRG